MCQSLSIFSHTFLNNIFQASVTNVNARMMLIYHLNSKIDNSGLLRKMSLELSLFDSVCPTREILLNVYKNVTNYGKQNHYMFMRVLQYTHWKLHDNFENLQEKAVRSSCKEREWGYEQNSIPYIVGLLSWILFNILSSISHMWIESMTFNVIKRSLESNCEIWTPVLPFKLLIKPLKIVHDNDRFFFNCII